MAGGGADMTFRTATWAEVCAAVGDHARRVSRARLFLVGAIVLLVAGALADVTVPIPVSYTHLTLPTTPYV